MVALTKKLIIALAFSIGGVASASPWPVGTDDTAVSIKNTVTRIPVLKNDSGDNLFIKEVNTTSLNGGTVRISPNKQRAIYTSTGDITEDEFWYVLEDDQGRTNAAKVTISVSDGIWPEANNIKATAKYNKAKRINVLRNDIGTDLTLVSVNKWSTNQGRVWINRKRNVVVYKQLGEPRGDITDEFWYVFKDKWGRKNSAKVVVSIKDTTEYVNPTAMTDSATSAGEEILIPVLENDTGSVLTIIESNEWTEQGGKTIIVNDKIRYTPPEDFVGADGFWYAIEDRLGNTNSARVEVEVGAQSNAVIAYCDSTYETDGTTENTTLTSLPETEVLSGQSIAVGYDPDTSEELLVNGRIYYIESNEATSASSLMMRENGIVSQVSDAGEYIVGAHANNVFYVADHALYSHDGETSTELVARLNAGMGCQSTAQASWVPSNSDDLYFQLQCNNITYGGTTSNKALWRLSIGDDEPVKLATSVSGSVSVSRAYSNPYLYKGYDFAFKTTRAQYSGQGATSVGRVIVSIKDEEETVRASGLFDSYIETAGRLFVTTKPYISEELEYLPGSLYSVDDETGDFTEIASCNSGHEEL